MAERTAQEKGAHVATGAIKRVKEPQRRGKKIKGVARDDSIAIGITN
ncbi:MAG: hypothetical protein LBR74_09670 [Eubacterium sp.]|nr:hypothetical protein [Eubacterium sp.]